MNINIIKNIQKVLGVEVDGILGPITRKAYANKLILIANDEVGTSETSKNQGPGIKKYWTATNYPDGYENREPWCAAYVCWCIKQCKVFTESNRPKTASAFGYEEWANNLGLTLIKLPYIIKRGDIVIYKFSHIGIATEDSDSDGDFRAIEGNTNDAGSREGGSVLIKSRNISSVRSVIRL